MLYPRGLLTGIENRIETSTAVLKHVLHLMVCKQVSKRHNKSKNPFQYIGGGGGGLETGLAYNRMGVFCLQVDGCITLFLGGGGGGL